MEQREQGLDERLCCRVTTRKPRTAWTSRRRWRRLNGKCLFRAEISATSSCRIHLRCCESQPGEPQKDTKSTKDNTSLVRSCGRVQPRGGADESDCVDHDRYRQGRKPHQSPSVRPVHGVHVRGHQGWTVCGVDSQPQL